MVLWKHKWRPIMFTLVVDYFVVQYTGQQHANHLHQWLLKYDNKVTIDCNVNLYCVITLNWQYEQEVLYISMPVYIENLFHKYQH